MVCIQSCPIYSQEGGVMASRQPLPISRYDTVYCNSNNQRNKYNHAPREDAQTKTMFLHVVIRTSEIKSLLYLRSLGVAGGWFTKISSRWYACLFLPRIWILTWYWRTCTISTVELRRASVTLIVPLAKKISPPRTHTSKERQAKTKEWWSKWVLTIL